MKTVYVVTPDPQRVDLAKEAFELKEEALQAARLETAKTGRRYYAVIATLDDKGKDK